MTLVRFNPMRDLLEVEREFSKIFNEFDQRFGFGRKEDNDQELQEATWAPLADIYEDNDNFKIKLDLPGISKDSVKISFSDGQLVIGGERKQELESENCKYHRVERNYGKFYRAFDVPKDIQEDKINAEFSNGQLSIVIPKSEKAKPRLIDVKAN
ncbi:MAG: Hsp20/alpha crystallin family protein [Melioribacteraceae bacterium]|nr:Hsp20/alpha crystallin family protein [Melioribacteraceae bacterium]